jgi:TolB protein
MVKHSRCIIALLLIVGFSAPSWAQAIQIGSTGTADKRFGVAAPDFACAPGLEALAKEMSEVISYDLLFTGLFTVLPKTAYPPTFTGFTADATQIDFTGWRAAKANYLVYAYVTAEGSNVQAECRMFDVNSGTQILGQRVMSTKDLPRLVAHRFSDEIVRTLDGVPGMATSEICFTRGATGKKEIFVSDYDGANAKQLTQHGAISIKPKFSPDGSKIAYVSFKDRYPYLYILDRATGKSTPLSKNVGLNAAASWAPDGKRLALVLSKDGNTEIYTKNIDGSGERRLTTDRASDSSPTFDPSGSQIAFVSERSGRPQIFVMGADGSGVRRISYQGGSAYDPVWSPDGKMIAYVASIPGEGFEIYVMNSDGSGARRLTDTGGSNESPSWSPDSRHVIFASTRSGPYEIWAVNVAPPCEQHRIGPGQGSYWGPRR